MIGRIAATILTVIAVLLLTMVVILFLQGKRRPPANGEYVAMGSSFAAGLGLGPREPGSPFVCMRSMLGYPHLLARKAGLSLVDVACSGSTTQHILDGGPAFLRAQLEAVGPRARLVTVTSGGNDVSYVGDMAMASGAAGRLAKLLWKGAKPLEQRDFAKVTANFQSIVRAIRARAPDAMVVLVSYPDILPPQGTCRELGIDENLAALGRQVAAGLHEATRIAAERSGALFVDMRAAGPGHDACSAEPWVNGASPTSGAPFHPSAAGSAATAQAVFKAVAPILGLAKS